MNVHNNALTDCTSRPCSSCDACDYSCKTCSTTGASSIKIY